MYRKNLVFAAACLGMLLFGIVFLSLGSVNNMLAERFGLDDRAIGTLTALLPFGILVGSLVFGPIVDRFGYRWMLVVASLIVGGALEGMAATSSRQLVQFCVFAIGFGGGMLNGATNALAADVSEGERGAKLSLLGVFFGIGALRCPARWPLSRTISRPARSSPPSARSSLIPAVYCLLIEFPPPKMRSARADAVRRLRIAPRPILPLGLPGLAIQSGMEGMSNDWMTRYFKKVVILPESFAERSAQLSLVALDGRDGCDAVRPGRRSETHRIRRSCCSPASAYDRIGRIVLLQVSIGSIDAAPCSAQRSSAAGWPRYFPSSWATSATAIRNNRAPRSARFSSSPWPETWRSIRHLATSPTSTASQQYPKVMLVPVGCSGSPVIHSSLIYDNSAFPRTTDHEITRNPMAQTTLGR